MRTFIILSFSILLFTSCVSTRPVDVTDSYHNCLPPTLSKDLKLLVKSFEDFKDRNYGGKLDSFILSVLRGDYPDLSYYQASDLALAERFRQNNFKDHIFSKYEEADCCEEEHTTPNETYQPSITSKKMQMVVDIEKPYLQCLTSVRTQGELIKAYVNFQDDYPVNPLLIGYMFRRHQTDKDYDTELMNTIIAVELYYRILEATAKYAGSGSGL